MDIYEKEIRRAFFTLLFFLLLGILLISLLACILC